MDKSRDQNDCQKTRKGANLWKVIKSLGSLNLVFEKHDDPITCGCYTSSLVFGLSFLLICLGVGLFIAVVAVRGDNGTIITSDDLMPPVFTSRVCKLLAHIGCIMGEQRRERRLLLGCSAVIVAMVIIHTVCYVIRFIEVSAYSDDEIRRKVVVDLNEYKGWTGAEFRRLFYSFLFGAMVTDIVLNTVLVWCCYVLADHVAKEKPGYFERTPRARF